MAKDFNIVVFISGRGSNLKAILENSISYKVKAVICSTKDAPGLAYAKQFKVPSYTFDRANFSSKSAYKEAIYRKTLELAPDLIALAGFMLVLDSDFVQQFTGKIVNIHPSLLPKYPGLDTHVRVMAAGDLEHGSTVHFVDTGVDTGPRIAQTVFAVEPQMSDEDLEKHALALEHKLYPWALTMIALGKVALNQGTVTFSLDALASAKQMGFKTFEH